MTTGTFGAVLGTLLMTRLIRVKPPIIAANGKLTANPHPCV
jgi:hypothetical protein